MQSVEYLIVPVWQAFVWLDEGLQNYLKSRGWPEVTRSQSMVMLNVVLGIVRPSAIARNLGISRQAIHLTLSQMVEIGLVELVPDPDDRRSKIVAISETGNRTRDDAQNAMRELDRVLRERLGSRAVDGFKAALAADWGPPMTWEAHPPAGPR